MGNTCSVVPTFDIQDIKTLGVHINDIQSFMRIREFITPKKVYTYLYKDGYIDTQGDLTTGVKPFNVFARYASRVIPNTVPQHAISQEFMICHNLPDNDSEWNVPSSTRGSMAGPDANGPGHVFMTSTNVHWTYFNILTIRDVAFLKRMRANAEKYANGRGWKRVGMYFHCFPLNNVQSLYLHIVNLDTVGPHHRAQRSKNLSLDDAIRVICNL